MNSHPYRYINKSVDRNAITVLPMSTIMIIQSKRALSPIQCQVMQRRQKWQCKQTYL
jgi:hypothetical protein